MKRWNVSYHGHIKQGPSVRNLFHLTYTKGSSRLVKEKVRYHTVSQMNWTLEFDPRITCEELLSTNVSIS